MDASEGEKRVARCLPCNVCGDQGGGWDSVSKQDGKVGDCEAEYQYPVSDAWLQFRCCFRDEEALFALSSSRRSNRPVKALGCFWLPRGGVCCVEGERCVLHLRSKDGDGCLIDRHPGRMRV